MERRKALMMAHLESGNGARSIMHVERIADLLRDMEDIYDSMQRSLML